jgi:hypothetical protein
MTMESVVFGSRQQLSVGDASAWDQSVRPSTWCCVAGLTFKHARELAFPLSEFQRFPYSETYTGSCRLLWEDMTHVGG